MNFRKRRGGKRLKLLGERSYEALTGKIDIREE